MTRKKTNVEFVQEVINQVGDEYEVLSEYVNAKTKVSFLHKSCGHTFEMMPQKFVLYGQRCPKHKGDRISKSKTKTHQLFMEEASRKRPDLKIIGQYNGSASKVQVRGKCGHSWRATPSNLFVRASGCPICKGHRDTVGFVIEMRRKYQGEFEILGEYENTNHPIMVKHECGEVFKRTPKKLLAHGGCPKCGQSRGEMMVQRWFVDKGIEFERQYRISECRNINPLPFDFKAVSKPSGEMVLIEIDGQQHFNSSNFWGRDKETAFAKLLKNDSIKNEFCLKNGIKLLRLPYWWFRTDRYKRELTSIFLSN